jgi:glycosyltransferase involved in cell wall biosynthesis
MRRVCFISGNISRSGGTERVTTVVASALADCGFDVSILSMIHGETSHFPLNPAVRLHSLHMEGYSANFSDFRIWSRLRRFLKREAIERIVDVDTVGSWYSIPSAWGTRAKVFAWEHFHLSVNVGDWPQRLRRSAGRRLAANWAAAIVTLTEKDRRQYLTNLHCHAPVIAIPNPLTITHNECGALGSQCQVGCNKRSIFRRLSDGPGFANRSHPTLLGQSNTKVHSNPLEFIIPTDAREKISGLWSAGRSALAAIAVVIHHAEVAAKDFGGHTIW